MFAVQAFADTISCDCAFCSLGTDKHALPILPHACMCACRSSAFFPHSYHKNLSSGSISRLSLVRFTKTYLLVSNLNVDISHTASFRVSFTMHVRWTRWRLVVPPLLYSPAATPNKASSGALNVVAQLNVSAGFSCGPSETRMTPCTVPKHELQTTV